MQTQLQIGTISEGTTKTEDSGPNLIWHVDRLDLDNTDLFLFKILKKEFSGEIEHLEESEEEYSEKLENIFDEIKEIADNYTPDYCYLGMSDCDGAAFGGWPVPDLFETTWPGGFDGFVVGQNI